MPLLCGEELQRYSQGRQIELLLYGEKGQNHKECQARCHSPKRTGIS